MTTTEQKQPAPALELVVARYREDLSWLREVCQPEGLSAHVYNKGPELKPNDAAPGVQVVALPNIGREAHTYLTHIIEHYGNLPRHTAFLQGNPFAHLAPPEEVPMSPVDLRRRLLDLVDKDVPFAGLAWFRLRCDGLGRPHDLADPAKQGRWKGWGKDIPVARTFEALLDAPAPAEFLVRAATGNMLVRADRILARPLAFYERALELVLADVDDAKNTGHAFERLWQTIFSGATPANPPRAGG